MAQEINIKGGRELQELLSTLPVKLERSILRGAMRAGAKVILDEAKLNVPVQSGELRNSLRISTNARGGKVTASVRAGNKQVWYSNFVEYGTAAHSISAKGGGSLNFGGIFTKSVMHTGARAKPFLRPALDTQSTEAINMIAAYIRRRLTKAGLNAPALEANDGE